LFCSSTIDIHGSRNPPVERSGLPVIRISAKLWKVASSVDVVVTRSAKMIFVEKKVKNRSKYFKATLQWRQNSSRLFSAFVLLYFFLIINNNIIHCYTFSSLRKIYTLFVFLIVLFRISLFFIVIVRWKNIHVVNIEILSKQKIN
jgi:hypothetical protein